MRRAKPRVHARGAKALTLALALTVLPLAAPGLAAADPIVESGRPASSVTSTDGSKVTRIEVRGDQQLKVYVYSAAMNKEIPLDVLRPKDTSVPRPTLYLLNGAGGGEDDASWQYRTDYVNFFADKNVNVITPIGGAFSYYTDWQKPDPSLGVNKWTTFLTKELPPLMDAALAANGRNAIGGLSSSGTSVLQLAIDAPGLYRGVAAYSGCAQTSDPIGQQYVKMTVNVWGGGNTDNMWGPVDDPAWAANDPYVHAEGLRGLDLYISNGTGLPGPHDTLGDPHVEDSQFLANQIVVGGLIEAATNYCTHNLQTKLDQLGIPAKYNFRDTGTHSWGYWQDDLKDSWPVLAKSLGL